MTSDENQAEFAWETLSTAIDYSCPGFDVRRDDVRLPDGTETDYHYVDESPAVVILPFTANSVQTTTNSDDATEAIADPAGREVVLVEEWRQAVGHLNQGLPAGSMESDETPSEAARRELREETGYEADRLHPLCTVEPTNGIADSVHHHFVADGCTRIAEPDLDFNETIQPTTTAYDELRAAVLAGTVRDGRTVLAVSRFELDRTTPEQSSADAGRD